MQLQDLWLKIKHLYKNFQELLTDKKIKILNSDESRWLASVHFAAGVMMGLVVAFEPLKPLEIIYVTVIAIASILMGVWWKAKI